VPFHLVQSDTNRVHLYGPSEEVVRQYASDVIDWCGTKVKQTEERRSEPSPMAMSRHAVACDSTLARVAALREDIIASAVRGEISPSALAPLLRVHENTRQIVVLSRTGRSLTQGGELPSC
jgi:hypothetical protein